MFVTGQAAGGVPQSQVPAVKRMLPTVQDEGVDQSSQETRPPGPGA
jgi:hypothetical protein